MKVTVKQMSKFNMLGIRVLFRTPQSKDIPEYLPGLVVNYNPDNHKATVVAWKPEGFNTTCHGVPYEPDMELNIPNAGCYCLFSDLEADIPEPLDTTDQLPPDSPPEEVAPVEAAPETTTP